MRRKNGTMEFTTNDFEMWEKMKFLLGQKESDFLARDSRTVGRDRYGLWSGILFGPIRGPDFGPGSYSVWLSIRIFLARGSEFGLDIFNVENPDRVKNLCSLAQS